MLPNAALYQTEPRLDEVQSQLFLLKLYKLYHMIFYLSSIFFKIYRLEHEIALKSKKFKKTIDKLRPS